MGLTARPPDLAAEYGELDRRLRDLETNAIQRGAGQPGTGAFLTRLLAYAENYTTQAGMPQATWSPLPGLRFDLVLTEARRVKLALEATLIKTPVDAASRVLVSIRYNGAEGQEIMRRTVWLSSDTEQAVHAERVMVLAPGTHRLTGAGYSYVGNAFTSSSTGTEGMWMAAEDLGPPVEFPPPPGDQELPPPPPPQPPPVPPTQETIRVVEAPVAAGLYGANANLGIWNFSVPRNGSIRLWGTLDCRMEYWNNNEGVGVGTRWVGTTVPGVGSSGLYRMPGGSGGGPGPRITVTRDDTWGIGAGGYQAAWQCRLAGGNQLRVYGGALHADWTG